MKLHEYVNSNSTYNDDDNSVNDTPKTNDNDINGHDIGIINDDNNNINEVSDKTNDVTSKVVETNELKENDNSSNTSENANINGNINTNDETNNISSNVINDENNEMSTDNANINGELHENDNGIQNDNIRDGNTIGDNNVDANNDDETELKNSEVNGNDNEKELTHEVSYVMTVAPIDDPDSDTSDEDILRKRSVYNQNSINNNNSSNNNTRGVITKNDNAYEVETWKSTYSYVFNHRRFFLFLYFFMFSDFYVRTFPIIAMIAFLKQVLFQSLFGVNSSRPNELASAIFVLYFIFMGIFEYWQCKKMRTFDSVNNGDEQAIYRRRSHLLKIFLIAVLSRYINIFHLRLIFIHHSLYYIHIVS